MSSSKILKFEVDYVLLTGYTATNKYIATTVLFTSLTSILGSAPSTEINVFFFINVLVVMPLFFHIHVASLATARRSLFP